MRTSPRRHAISARQGFRQYRHRTRPRSSGAQPAQVAAAATQQPMRKDHVLRPVRYVTSRKAAAKGGAPREHHRTVASAGGGGKQTPPAPAKSGWEGALEADAGRSCLWQRWPAGARGARYPTCADPKESVGAAGRLRRPQAEVAAGYRKAQARAPWRAVPAGGGDGQQVPPAEGTLGAAGRQRCRGGRPQVKRGSRQRWPQL